MKRLNFNERDLLERITSVCINMRKRTVDEYVKYVHYVNNINTPYDKWVHTFDSELRTTPYNRYSSFYYQIINGYLSAYKYNKRILKKLERFGYLKIIPNETCSSIQLNFEMCNIK